MRFDPRSRAGSDSRSTPQRRREIIVSIHAPVRGATSGRRSRWIRIWMFRSTLPCGERLVECPAGRSIQAVSIHAPVRGATVAGADAAGRRGSFDPRSRAGSDRAAYGAMERQRRFRSTLPCGERRAPDFSTMLAFTVSIHAPVRGATLDGGAIGVYLGRFDPRSRAGSDTRLRLYSYKETRFDPRSRAGSDL